MDEIVKNYLAALVTPELMEVLTISFEYVHRFGIDTLDDEVDAIIANIQNEETATNVSAVITTIRNVVISIVQEHGIEVKDDTTLDDLNSLLDGLFLLQDYEDLDALENIVEADYAPAEAFAEAISLVSELQPEHALMILEDVSMQFIYKLKNMVELRKSLLEDPAADFTPQIELLKRLVATIGNDSMIMFDMLKTHLVIGMPFGTYLAVLVPHLESLSEEMTAREILAAAFASSDSYQNPRTMIRGILESYIEDPQFISRVDLAITKLLSGMSLNETF